jgi:Ran GTPase-activating protein (RanGAP) involved in mRNA processing and transport
MDNVSVACQQLERHDASLTLLNLSCEGMGSEGLKKISRSCCAYCDKEKCQSSLVALWLENNEIYPGGAQALSDIVQASPKLRYLYMAHNAINNTGSSTLSSAAFRSLEVCNLTDNQIGPMGARSIAKNLCDSTVKTLILDDNKLRDDGVKLLAEGLKENTTLTTLSLKFNHIGQEGLFALRNVLIKDNMTLENLLLEEEDEHCQATTSAERREQKKKKCQKLLKQMRKNCSCATCKLRNEIEYYLALNRAGRHSFCNMQVPVGLWPRILARVSNDDPLLLYDMISLRPDLGRSI